jgi:hypothetical protein
MKITQLFEVETKESIMTGEEIATIIVNLNRGLILKDIRTVDNKIKYLFECSENLGKEHKNTKHIPGPWRKGNTCDSVISDTEISVKGLLEFREECLEYYGGYLVAESIAPENIDLISAAPELLEALEMAVSWLTNTPEGRSIPQVNGQPGEWLEKAREVIVKAKGEKSCE